MTIKTHVIAALLALGLAVRMGCAADLDFEPLAGSAYDTVSSDARLLNLAPWRVPAGFEQIIVSDESHLDLFRNGDGSLVSDWPDMLTVNETGRHAGRYLYRTHEVRPAIVSPFPGAAISVVDRKTGETRLLAQQADWEALDGLVWTPWGSLLFGEEIIAAGLPDPRHPSTKSGLLYELQLDPQDPTRAQQVAARPLLGALAHEGIKLDAAGNVYVIDEHLTGSIYKFVPKTVGDLSQGQLYALKVEGQGKVGAASWVALDMAQVPLDARLAAKAAGATAYCRPEDLERIGNTLYAALTCEDHANPSNLKGDGAVLAVSLQGAPRAQWFVLPGLNVPREDRALLRTGLRYPDNLAQGADGRLWIAEDNVPADIWMAEPDRNGDGLSDGLHLFASLQDAKAEATGIYLGRDPRKLFVNVQHSATKNDKTMLIQPVRAATPVDFDD